MCEELFPNKTRLKEHKWDHTNGTDNSNTVLDASTFLECEEDVKKGSESDEEIDLGIKKEMIDDPSSEGEEVDLVVKKEIKDEIDDIQANGSGDQIIKEEVIEDGDIMPDIKHEVLDQD